MFAPRNAIATLCVGSESVALWRKYCARSWTDYAQRHGYALEVFEEPLDQSPRARSRSVAWQKCLILSNPKTSQYERVVWVDADIVIAPDAPPIIDAVPIEKVGAVISGDYLQNDMKAVFLERIGRQRIEAGKTAEAWSADQRSFYVSAGIDCASSDIVQTGVLVFSRRHRMILEKVYEIDLPSSVIAFEQFPLSASILNQGLFHRVDCRFNFVFFEQMVVHHPYLLKKNLVLYATAAKRAVMTEYANSYFLHFAGAQNFMQFLDPAIYRESANIHANSRPGATTYPSRRVVTGWPRRAARGSAKLAWSLTLRLSSKLRRRFRHICTR
jgi:hypothetical protein